MRSFSRLPTGLRRKTKMLPQNNSKLLSLRLLSTQIGADPLLVQGPGGNTSIKIGEVLWVKASGKSLIAASSEEIFIPISYKSVRQKLLEGMSDPLNGQIIGSLTSSTLRPSIETTLHAIMTDPIVVHVHCVNTIGRTVTQNAKIALAKLLAGEKWAWIPYRRPGLSLAQEILKRKLESVQTLVLGNHGLVVTGQEPEQVSELLERIVKRLRLKPRRVPNANIEQLQNLCANTPYCVPPKAEWHSLAVDKTNLKIVSGGSLYPDHVIFLGSSAAVMSPIMLARKHEVGKEIPKLLLVPSSGILALKNISQAEKEMIQCLVDVVRRVSGTQKINYLTQFEEKELLNWDAEKYRISLNTDPASSV